jgi:crotonobetainyl-CoA:carnitine CoA-transferase CaiB-like acyl-CoA transferase
VTERLGIDPDTLTAHNPPIITCSLTGFGGTGPDRDRPGYDYLVQALSGTMSLTGDPAGPPTKYGISVVDHVGGLFAALGVSAALVARNADPQRRGRHVDTALFDTHLSMLTYLAAEVLNGGAVPERQPMSAHPALVPAQLFATADDYVVVMPLAQHFFPPLCAAVGLPELAEDPRYADAAGRLAHRDELLATLNERFAERPTAEWLAVLEEAGIPSSPVQTVDQALVMDQVEAREMVVELTHPGYGSYRAVGNPLRISASGPQPLAAAPFLGEHTHQVLTELAGLSTEDVAALRREGAA